MAATILKSIFLASLTLVPLAEGFVPGRIGDGQYSDQLPEVKSMDKRDRSSYVSASPGETSSQISQLFSPTQFCPEV